MPIQKYLVTTEIQANFLFHILLQLEKEEEELEDKFDISVSVKDPEKIGETYHIFFILCFHSVFILNKKCICMDLVLCNKTANFVKFVHCRHKASKGYFDELLISPSGDGMNAYMAYKVTTQVTTC